MLITQIRTKRNFSDGAPQFVYRVADYTITTCLVGLDLDLHVLRILFALTVLHICTTITSTMESPRLTF
jgi:hypothetical protein